MIFGVPTISLVEVGRSEVTVPLVSFDQTTWDVKTRKKRDQVVLERKRKIRL